MDHRISKDMISSGMIPSGEKKQEDLSRTQYGTAPSPNALADVYKSMYEKKEETLNEHHKKDADGNTIPHEDEEINEAGPLAPLVPLLGKVSTIMKGAKTAAIRTGIKFGGKGGGKFVKGAIEKPLSTAANVSYASNLMPRTSSSSKDGTGKTSLATAGVDLFDIVKGQLLDEGLSEEEIRDIMLTLTPEEIIVETGLSVDLLRSAAKGAERARQVAAKSGDRDLAVKKSKQSQTFSSAMKKKNLENQTREANRKPTQYDSPLTKPMMDYSKPYPKSSD